MPATRDDLMAMLDRLGIATTTVEHPPLFTVEKVAGAARRDSRRPHQEPVPQGQEGRALPGHRARGRRHRPEAPPPPDRRLRPRLLRQAGAADGDARRAARRGHAVRRDQRHRRPASRSSSTPRWWPTTAINCHPLVNTATTTIAAADLLAFLRATGHEPRIRRRLRSSRRPRPNCENRRPPLHIWPGTSSNRRIPPKATDRFHEHDMTDGCAAGPAAKAGNGADLDQGHHHPDLRQGRPRGIAPPAGAGRFLGAVVRPLQDAVADHREGGHAPPRARSAWSR